MMKAVGVVATICALSGAFATYKGWIKPDIEVTNKGKAEAREMANSALDSARRAINEGLTSAQETVKETK